MSKFGAHITSGPRNGFGAALKQCADAGSPVPVLFSLDQDVWPDVQQYSPDTVVVFRTQPDGDDNPCSMYTGDPLQVAQSWYSLSRPKWLLNHADYYAPCNERNPVLFAPQLASHSKGDTRNQIILSRYAQLLPLTSEQNTWLDEFDYQMMLLAEADGFKLALHGASVGTPDYPAWQYYRKSLGYAAQHGHVLLLHEYGLDTTLQEASPDLVLRYRKVRALIESFAPGLKMIIGECSGGCGYSNQGVSWLNDLEWYDSEAMRDPYLIGFCGYQLGGAENWQQLIPQWADYVSTHPTPDVEPPPDVSESYQGEFAGYSWSLFDSDTSAWFLEGDHLSAGYPIFRDSMQHHGGLAEALLYWNHAVYCTNGDVPPKWFKALPDGWERIDDDPRKGIVVEPPPVEHRLVVPWIGQNTTRTDDDYTNSDCGAATVNMWLRYRGVNVSVDDVSRATGKPPKYTYTVFADLDKAANVYGLNLRHMYGTVTLANLRAEIDAGRPAIVLVHYQSLPRIYDPTYFASHWILIVGYTETGFFYHDSYWPDAGGANIPIVSAQLLEALQNVTLNNNRAMQGAYEQLTQPPPASTAMSGLEMRADGNSLSSDYEALRAAKCNAAKIMTNTGFDEMDNLIALGIAPDHIVLRLFAAGDNPSLKNAAQFVNEQSAWLTYFKNAGGRYVEIHNEPNLRAEGMFDAWADPSQFGAWYEDVASLIRANFPVLLCGWPGLSPQSSTDQRWLPDAAFIPAMQHAINAGRVDWIGAHAYWGNAAGVDDPANGRYYRRLMSYGKDVMVTEFSNNQTADADAIKGAQYKHYYQTLEQGVIGAFAFVSSASAEAYNLSRETWVRGGVLTAIPAAVGA